MVEGYSCVDYLAEDKVFSFSQKSETNLQFYMKVACKSDAFVDFQRELLEDAAASIREKLSVDILLEEDIKRIFEQELQNLNASLQAFVAKMRTEEYFSLRWVVWIVYQGVLMASLIGDVSLFILRNNAVHYSMHNDTEIQWSIDVFADFIEGELELHDKIILIGTNYQHVINKTELKQLHEVLEQVNTDVLAFMEKLFLARISSEELSFLLLFDYALASDDVHVLRARHDKKKKEAMYKRLQHVFLRHRYSVTVLILWVVVLFLWYHILIDAFQSTSDLPQIETDEGTQIVTIESIQQDIDYFQHLDVSSNEKWRLYKDIMEKLHFLDSLGRWPEDVAKLKKIVQNKYYEGFNVVYMNSLETSTDTPLLYPFSADEKATLGNPVALYFSKNLYIAGDKWAVVGGISSDIKGTPLKYDLDSLVKWCSLDLTRQGMFCFTTDDSVIRITKWVVEPVTLAEWAYFDGPIKDIDVFNKNSMYVLHDDVSGSGKYITKYVNLLGKYTEFQKWLEYQSLIQNESGSLLPAFYDFAIDGTFLTWSPADKVVYHLRRSKGANILSYRPVRMVGGDTIEESYSNSVKILSPDTSYYVYLFDKENQTLTTYRSTPSKISENNSIIQDANFSPTYQLDYVFRFKFDLTSAIIDVAVPSENGNKPYLYLLTSGGVHQVALHEFIKQYQQ